MITQLRATNHEVLDRLPADVICVHCAAKKGQLHELHCWVEICPLCENYLTECKHLHEYVQQTK